MFPVCSSPIASQSCVYHHERNAKEVIFAGRPMVELYAILSLNILPLTSYFFWLYFLSFPKYLDV
jgi:hypothetical protein